MDYRLCIYKKTVLIKQVQELWERKRSRSASKLRSNQPINLPLAVVNSKCYRETQQNQAKSAETLPCSIRLQIKNFLIEAD